MLTPNEIQGITFKNGRGYKKDDVDSFMKALHHDYEIMYKENVELKEKINTLNEGVQYYKNLEKTLQKALVLAEKTSEETKTAALKNAESIEHEAKLKAEKILYEARQEMHQIEAKTQELLQTFELYKLQYKQVITSQMELVNSATFDIQKKEVQVEEPEKEQKQKQKEIKIPKAVQEKKEEPVPVQHVTGQKALLKNAAGNVISSERRNVMDSAEKAVPKEKMEEVIKENVSKELDIQNELASSIEEIEREARTNILKDDTALEKGKIKKETITSSKSQEANDEETNLEIRMLQKLLNEIKKNSDTESNEEEFEFIDTDSNEE